MFVLHLLTLITGGGLRGNMERLTEKAICAAHGCNLENCDCRDDCELLVDTRKVAQAQRKKCAEWLIHGKARVVVPGKLIDITVTVTPEEFKALKELAEVERYV